MIERKIRVVTQKGNTKSEVWRDLGFNVKSYLSKLTGEAEDNYDRSLGIGLVAPLYPDGGRGFPYPVDVALEKILAIIEQVNEGEWIAADVCWVIQEPSGDWVAFNKPGEDPRDIEEVLSRWEGNRRKPVFSMAGAALYDAQSGSVSLWSVVLNVGIVNPNITRGKLWDLIRKNVNRSTGGLSLSDCYGEGVFLPGEEGIKYSIYSHGSDRINFIDDFNKIRPTSKLLKKGSLSFDAVNNPGIYRLLFGL